MVDETQKTLSKKEVVKISKSIINKNNLPNTMTKTKEQQELAELKHPELKCAVSQTGFHLYDLFQIEGKQLVAICTRCLQQLPITLLDK
jgi:hypothetical protein